MTHARHAQENGSKTKFDWMRATAEISDIEVYIKADPKDAIYEYWLPVVKKEDYSGCIND